MGYDLVQDPGKIYPLQDVQLNCALAAGAKGIVQWQVNGVDPFLNRAKYSVLNNNRTLKVISVSAADAGE